ncbi:MAG: hypothetical protein WBD40_00310 [Tepidisphaeraceae bacterium]
MKPPASRRVVALLAVSSLILLAALVVLHRLDIRLGQGSFAYRYSPLYGYRVVRAAPTVLLAGAAVVAVWFLCVYPQRRRLGLALFTLATASLVAWTWWAPPQQFLQHTFNFHSPSHDGAFVLEARAANGPGDYLRNFEGRLALSTEEMRGTRVLSNPPGMTLIAMGAMRVFPPNPKDPWALDRWALATPPGILQTTTWPSALRVALATWAMWALSGLFAYLLGRAFLSAPGAAVFTLIVLFNPSTVHFVPGKDPAQLLTINAMLWTGLAGWRRGSTLLAAISGALLMAGTLIGLIHVWVALAAGAAVAWQTWRTREPMSRLIVRTLLPAAGGAVVFALAIYLASGWNPITGLLAVQRSFARVQPQIAVNHTLWLFIGLPIFLIFTSPAFWTAALLSGRRIRRGDGFGRRLLICTLAAMAATYVFGVPYELPRLWVVFLPPLALGAMIDLPMFHAEQSPRRVWRPLAMIVAVQILFTSLHWTMFDVRESEYRLTTERLWS